MPINEGMRVYTELGFAGLFAFVFLIVFGYLLWELKQTNKEKVRMVEKTTIALEQSAQTNRDLIAVVSQLKHSIEEGTRQSGQLEAYFRGKDSAGGRR